MSEFKRAGWLRGPHFQTIVGRYIRPAGGVSFRRERLELDDGDFLDLDFADVSERGWSALGSSAPICLVLHGLEGSARSAYAVETHRRLAAAGVRSVGLNFRGCSGQLNRLPRAYHSGETGDLRFVLERLASRYPEVSLGAIGFSLGGNVLLKYLGECGAATPLSAAAVVSVPFDLGACAAALAEGFSRVYARHLLGSLTRKLRAKGPLVAPHCDLERGLRARTFFDFDDAVTAPLHGMRGARHYYETCSSRAFLARIRVPVALVQSTDDPFVPADSIPRALIAANTCLTERFSPFGGHVGFVSGWPWRRQFWGERTAVESLVARL